MILRKLANAIREQNWFTVALEVLIVVVGIFIGLQVDDWNSARIDRQRAQAYAARITSDLSDDIRELEKRRKFWGEVAKEGRIALAYGEEGAVPDDGAWVLLRSLLNASQVWRFVFNQTTYLEMRSAGDLHLLGDSQLRSDLAYYYVTIAERRGAGMYQSLPKYRETIRSLMDSRISEYYWQSCHRQDLAEQVLKSCLSPIDEREALVLLEDIFGDRKVVPELRFWIDTLTMLNQLAVDDIEYAETLAGQLTESFP